MGTRRRRNPVIFFFWFFMAFELCASLNHEGVALLRFKEMIVADPFDALLDWDEGNASPCSWFGVECSGDGRVMALNLPNLGLKGMLPQEIGKLAFMHSLILHNNSFYGIIPTEIGDLQELKVLDLGYNNFSGPFPSDLRSILPLEFLFLKGNNLSGGLPLHLHELTRLCELRVHQDKASTARNEENSMIERLLARKQKYSQKARVLLGSGPSPFSGMIWNPPNPSMPPLHNREPLQPRPPQPQRPPEPIPSPAPPVSATTNQAPSKESKSRHSSAIYASIGVMACLVVVALSAAFFLWYRRRKTGTVVPFSPTASGQLQNTTIGGITSYRRSELETACEGFSNVIDTLPGYTLYKGTLPGGAEIAVVSTVVTYTCGWTAIAETQFKNMVDVLSKVSHKNFMNLVGYCEDEEPFTRMMVFEYVPNGTLFEHLHVKEAEQLNWQSRLRVAMGVIYCLNYMQQQNPPVPLTGLSTSCIYLTEDNAAKVSDISFWGGKKEEVKSDASDEHNKVHKFALLLLETISGRRPYSDDYGLLILWAHRYLIGEKPLMDMVDPTLKSVPEEHVRALTELVKLCLSDDPSERPTVAEVTSRMQEITGISEDQAIPRNSPLWWAELEIITS
ncbi:protein MALE DISCOVERER 2-like [Oryza brachyantha]|uniref:Protein kinase domain-containing protein n=1 Tax=Oryza brachyantha TaxID=4533 RepID=J3M818_ORYBR|nr:protein MALE DISCOVERER 2-like [Oryza brachyantha]